MAEEKSKFWLKKMNRYFDRIDFDHDGDITIKDFKGMAQRFVDTGTLSEKNAELLKETMLNIWAKYQEALGHGAEQISRSDFIKAMKDLVKDPTLKPTLEAPLPLFFQAVDANHDGYIQEDEFRLFFKILGLNENEADVTFKAIDTNSDGLLSKEEFTDAGSEFFISEDDKKPTKDFWGPLGE